MELISLKNGKLLTIREAEPGDAAALLAFSKVIGSETDFLGTDENGWRQGVEEEREILVASLIASDRGVFLCLIDGEIAGLFSIYPLSRKPRTRQNAVFGIALRQSCWGLGIGPVAMALSIDWAKEWGYRKMLLEARADNARAIALYRRFGFAECGRRREHILVNGQYYDEIIMERML
ncbi:MAG TPA: GNAT family N-acetyltransferase [Clostridia bacterium]|nr:GNAT family N-acetyltransferase [Clostridia bacterium]